MVAMPGAVRSGLYMRWILFERGRDSSGTLGARLEKQRDQTGPSGLMGRADAASAITVEILIKQDVVAEVGVPLLDAAVAEHRSVPVSAAEKETGQPVRQLLGDLAQA